MSDERLRAPAVLTAPAGAQDATEPDRRSR